MRSILLLAILIFAFSNLNAQLALVSDSTTYTRCVQEKVEVKFKLANDTTRTIYTWWEQRGITTDPRNDWRVGFRNIKRNSKPYIHADIDYRPKKYIIESIRGTPHWYPLEIGQNLNLGSSYFGSFLNAKEPGEYSFEIGFRYNWGDTLEFVPKGSPDFSWGEIDTTWTTININFKNCPDSIYFIRATNKWKNWITYKDDYALLYYCAESNHFNLVDSIITLLEDNHNILSTNAGVRTVWMIAGKGITQDQTKKLIEGFAGYNFIRQNDSSYNASGDLYRNRIFSIIAANTTREASNSIFEYQNDDSAEIRKSVLHLAAKFENNAVLQKLRDDTNREIRQRAKGYLRVLKKKSQLKNKE